MIKSDLCRGSSYLICKYGGFLNQWNVFSTYTRNIGASMPPIPTLRREKKQVCMTLTCIAQQAPRRLRVRGRAASAPVEETFAMAELPSLRCPWGSNCRQPETSNASRSVFPAIGPERFGNDQFVISCGRFDLTTQELCRTIKHSRENLQSIAYSRSITQTVSAREWRDQHTLSLSLVFVVKPFNIAIVPLPRHDDLP